MVITFKENVPVDLSKVTIGYNDLECEKHMKYLGIVIDDKLKFNKNMEMLQKKTNKKINFI
jgi:sorbitol-specific phosphotransferase system component IIA